ncbi:hypothetical protein Snas_5122 [Stackebrandtia nassauensis DSM 44728]|uniref:Permease n=1 Tax=Stackebrandtia nassauensis (strain DSM 44728 / CIP 108903 / NRRL B-16338 / NBRC 102104 / LLR-40K-21) TaxID=446470 RepID=D3QAW1_STANL|nr:hypothetical protein Snas_5122 [Stackebrandtia nassauensis DSM 44728]
MATLGIGLTMALDGRGSLTRRLLAVGRVAGRRGESGDVRFVSLLLATVLLSLGLVSLVAVHAGYAGVWERTQARLAVEAEDTDDPDSVVLMKFRDDSLADGRTFDVVVVDPGENATKPPGVDTWPGPGEVLLSPALREDGTSENIEQRYGTPVGTVGQDGLTDPMERMAYVGARDGLDPGDPNVTRVIAFGDTRDEWALGGFHSHDRPEWSPRLLVFGLLVAPALAFVFVASRTGSHLRDRRIALVTALGGRGRDRVWLSIGEAWRPVSTGAVVTGCAAAVSMFVDVPVPVIGYVMSAADMRGVAVNVVLAILGAFALVMSTVVWTNRHRRHTSAKRGGASTRPVGSMRPLTWGWAALCPIMIFTAVFLPDLVFAPGTPRYVYCGWLGTVGTALTLPAIVAAGTIVSGRVLAKLGRARRNAGQLVAGRRTAVHSPATGRMVAGITIGVFLFLQAVGWQSIFASQSLFAEQRQELLGRGAVQIESESAELGGRADIEGFLDRLSPHSRPIAVTRRDGDGDEEFVTVHGSCGDLRSTGLKCQDGASVEFADAKRMDQWLSDVAFGAVHGLDHIDEGEPMPVMTVDVTDRLVDIVASQTGGYSPELLIFDERGHDIDVPTMKQTAYRYLPSGAEIELTTGDTGYSAALRDQSRWVFLFGVIAVAIMAAAAALSGAAEFLRHGKSLAPLTVLTGRFTVFRTGAAWVVSLPLCLGIGASLAVGVWLAKPLDFAGFISPGLVATIVIVTLVLSAAMSLWAGQVAVRQARRWRPSGAD